MPNEQFVVQVRYSIVWFVLFVSHYLFSVLYQSDLYFVWCTSILHQKSSSVFETVRFSYSCSVRFKTWAPNKIFKYPKYWKLLYRLIDGVFNVFHSKSVDIGSFKMHSWMLLSIWQWDKTISLNLIISLFPSSKIWFYTNRCCVDYLKEAEYRAHSNSSRIFANNASSIVLKRSLESSNGLNWKSVNVYSVVVKYVFIDDPSSDYYMKYIVWGLLGILT